MKRTIFVLIFIILLCSCDITLDAPIPETNAETNKNNYEMNSSAENSEFDSENQIQTTKEWYYVASIMSGVENGVFESSFYDERGNTVTENVAGSSPVNINVGKKNINATLTERKTQNGKTIGAFYISDKTEYFINSDSFRITVIDDSSLCEYKETDLTYEKLLSNIKKYIAEYVDVTLYVDYQFKCTSSLVIHKPNATWGETREGFYIPSNDDFDITEKVTGYEFEYRRVIGQVETDDVIRVNCDSNGNIIKLYCCTTGANWASFKIDDQKLSDCIEKKLNEALNSGYEIIDWAIESKSLVYEDESVMLSVSAEVTVKQDEFELSVLCPIMISVQHKA